MQNALECVPCSLKLVCVSAEDKGRKKTIRLLDEPLLLLSVNVVCFSVVFIHKEQCAQCCRPLFGHGKPAPSCLELPWWKRGNCFSFSGHRYQPPPSGGFAHICILDSDI